MGLNGGRVAYREGSLLAARPGVIITGFDGLHREPGLR
jgi:hypothetical protein